MDPFFFMDIDMKFSDDKLCTEPSEAIATFMLENASLEDLFDYHTLCFIF